jgi:AAA family ATP:ADP antiporter
MSNIFVRLMHVFWPFRSMSELRLFLPLALMMGGMLYNFGTLRMLRDGILVSHLGPEVLSFAEMYVSLPIAVCVTIGMFALYRRGSLTFVLGVMCAGFISFFFFFGWVWYPHLSYWHIDRETLDGWVLLYPRLKWLILLWGHWSFALLHSASELWAAAMFNVLFWQIANAILSTDQAKRLYLLFGVLGNFGTILSGKVISSMANRGKSDADYIQDSLWWVILITALIFLVFQFLRPYLPLHASSRVSKKDKPSVLAAIKIVLRSPYLGLIALLILCYGMSMNIVEAQWKAYARTVYQDTQSLTAYIGQFMMWVGISTMAFMVVGSVILQRFSWLTAALVPAMTMGMTALVMFTLTNWSRGMDSTALPAVYGGIMVMASYFCAIQNILVKSSKYTLFDATKEMAYIPLDPLLKTQGKAAVDLVGGRVARSGGACVQTVLLMLLPQATLLDLGIWMWSFVLICSLVWVGSAMALHRSYENLLLQTSK